MSLEGEKVLEWLSVPNSFNGSVCLSTKKIHIQKWVAEMGMIWAP